MEATSGGGYGGGSGRKPEDMDAVQVCVRIRPLSSKEKAEQTKSCVRIASSPLDGLAETNSSSAAQSGPQQIVVGKDRAFTFDNVLGVGSSQAVRLHSGAVSRSCSGPELALGSDAKDCVVEQDSFRHCVAPLNEDIQGIIPRVSDAQILSETPHRASNVDGLTTFGAAIQPGHQSNLQAHGSEPAACRVQSPRRVHRDLQRGVTRPVASGHAVQADGRALAACEQQLNIREDAEGNIVVAGVKSEVAQTREAVFRYLVLGGASRATGSTLMNEQSSRSHAIFSLILHQRDVASGHAAKQSEDAIARMKEEIASLQTKLQQSSHSSAVSRPVSATSTRSGQRRPSSSTSASSSSADSVARITGLEQQLGAATRKLQLATEAVESMRSLSLEAITALIAMEREVKPLGRPVQQQLNEVVKRLNAVIQTANACELRERNTSRSSDRPEHDDEDAASAHEEQLAKVAKELKDAKNDLARDEQIFEMKNAEIQRLQTVLLDAKSKNEKLIERVQQLERGGQLWSNVETVRASNAELAPSHSSASVADSKSTHDDDTDRVATARAASSTNSVRSAKAPTSRGLFTKRGGTGTFDGDEDNVVIGTGDDDEKGSSSTKAARAPTSRSATSTTSSSRRASGADSAKAVDNSRTCSTATEGPGGNRSELTSSSGRADAVGKLEKTIATLRTKIEELQQQNHSREESTRRWQLDRQTYERQVNDAEQMIETLRKEKQALEDTLIEEKGLASSALTASTSSAVADAKSSARHSSRTKSLELEIKDAASEGPATQRQRSSADAKHRLSVADAKAAPSHRNGQRSLVVVFEECVLQLIAYSDARRQVLGILKEKKDAEQSKDEAAKRVNALEMQKLRQSLSVRESISDVSKSIRLLNDKMHAESRSLEELERLKKLKERAERKLRGLRKQEEHEEFLDGDTQQELVDLVELIEDLDSHIAFQDAELSAARSDLDAIKQRSRADNVSPIDGLVDALAQRLRPTDDSPVDVAEFIKRVLEDVARLRGREQELLLKLSEQRSVVEERSAALQQLETGLGAARKEFDRRLELQQQDSRMQAAQLEQQIAALTKQQLPSQSQAAATAQQPQTVELDPTGRDDEWKRMIVSSQKKDEYIADLEKHLVFYKSKAKQMQTQLQQLIRDTAKCNQEDDEDDDNADEGDGNRDEDNPRRARKDASHQLMVRIRQLEEANDALTKDLATAKIYLRSSKPRSSSPGDTHVVRVSRSELRELPGGPPSRPSS
ncbi:hypothetical protein PybrP1_002362 [[Pythium] brassicae (nom. inval.)]|nr:hypothetical protein PybrP1_002362 [[Pythium] brassicae (nom. inval.)]